MKRYWQIYIHLVWGTKARSHILRGPVEMSVHKAIREEARAMELVPVCVNSAWNHTHVLLSWNPSPSSYPRHRRIPAMVSHQRKCGDQCVLFVVFRLRVGAGGFDFPVVGVAPFVYDLSGGVVFDDESCGVAIVDGQGPSFAAAGHR